MKQVNQASNHLAEIAQRPNACACGDCYHPSFGPNTDGEPCPWCRDCACHRSDHVGTDRHGDPWTPGDDGLMHTPETAPFPREHVEKKWGPLRYSPATLTESVSESSDDD